MRTTDTPPPKPLRSLKPAKKEATHRHFVDRARVRVMGGNGGNGCVQMLSLYANEFAGPAGGDGGNGGHVVFKASQEVSSLSHLSLTIAGNPGGKGGSTNKDGKNGLNKLVLVPVGTAFRNCHTNQIVAQLTAENEMFLAAKGGAGGKGNAHFKTAENQAPQLAEAGGEGECFEIIVELLTMADVGFLGFPNAGKSTLLRAMSRARPKVAAYPFTTLRPHIGMVPYEDGVQVAVADIPGIIEDAHKDKGLGIEFLRHIERCACLLYVIDMSSPDANSQDDKSPFDQFEALRYELSQYNADLPDRPFAVVANKMDLDESEGSALETLRAQLKEKSPDVTVFEISAKYGTNISQLLQFIRTQFDVRCEANRKLIASK